MALLKCPECGHDVSDRAKACPECGYPVPEASAEETTPECEASAPLISAKKLSKGKVLLMVGAVVAVAIIGVAIFAFSHLTEKASIVPYNLSWGDPYSKLKRANSETTEIKKNDAGSHLCSCDLAPSYIGLDDEAIRIGASWNFENGETLQSVLIIVSPEDACSMTTEQVYGHLSNHYSTIFDAEPTSEYPFRKEWQDDTYHLEVSYWSDDLLIIDIEPAS